MAYQYANTLSPGNPFRDWLVEKIVTDKLNHKHCLVDVFKSNSSHTVCKYYFKGEHYSVVAKFFSELTGQLKNQALLSKYI